MKIKIVLGSLMCLIMACEPDKTCDNSMPHYNERLEVNENVIPFEIVEKYEKYIWKCKDSHGNEHNYYITTDHTKNVLAIWKKPEWSD